MLFYPHGFINDNVLSLKGDNMIYVLCTQEQIRIANTDTYYKVVQQNLTILAQYLSKGVGWKLRTHVNKAAARAFNKSATDVLHIMVWWRLKKDDAPFDICYLCWRVLAIFNQNIL